jgi:hypothetical protein
MTLCPPAAATSSSLDVFLPLDLAHVALIRGQVTSVKAKIGLIRGDEDVTYNERDFKILYSITWTAIPVQAPLSRHGWLSAWVPS